MKKQVIFNVNLVGK